MVLSSSSSSVLDRKCFLCLNTVIHIVVISSLSFTRCWWHSTGKHHRDTDDAFRRQWKSLYFSVCTLFQLSAPSRAVSEVFWPTPIRPNKCVWRIDSLSFCHSQVLKCRERPKISHVRLRSQPRHRSVVQSRGCCCKGCWKLPLVELSFRALYVSLHQNR